MTTKSRKYCSVYGCFNKDSLNPDLSFFCIPTEEEQRIQWLRLIDREDLSQQSTLNARVCEAHFKAKEIFVNTKRKRLRKNCLPSLLLPTKKDEETQTDITIDNASSQIDLPTCSVLSLKIKQEITESENSTQTGASLSADTPCKRKLESDLSNLEKRLKVNEIGEASDTSQRDTHTDVTTDDASSSQTDLPTCSVSSLKIKQEVTESENPTQTSASLSADTPCKRKLESDLSNLEKRLKVNEMGEASDTSQRDTQTDITTDDASSSQNDLPTCSVSSLKIKQEITESENPTQTSASLSADTPCKRKLESDLSNLEKRLKVNEMGEASDTSQRDTRTDITTDNASTSQNDLPTCSVSSLKIKQEITESENPIQTAASLSAVSPCKRKLESDLSNLEKRLKANEIEASDTSQRDMFFELCDRFLSKKLADVVKEQVLQAETTIASTQE